jgi:hypothetical protein
MFILSLTDLEEPITINTLLGLYQCLIIDVTPLIDDDLYALT